MVTTDMGASCCFLEGYLSKSMNWHLLHDCASGPQRGRRDSWIPAITRRIACVGKTSSAPTGPLSAGDGVDGMSSITVSLALGMEAMEIFSWSMEPKAPSRVSRIEEVLQPARAILIFPKPSHFSLAAFSSKWVANSINVKP